MTEDNPFTDRPPSCTFMDIAKRFGVDYGDVLMATETFRSPPIAINRLHCEAAYRIGARCAYAVMTACTERWNY